MNVRLLEKLDNVSLHAAQNMLTALGIARPPLPVGAQTQESCETHDDPWSCDIAKPNCVLHLEITLVAESGGA